MLRLSLNNISHVHAIELCVVDSNKILSYLRGTNTLMELVPLITSHLVNTYLMILHYESNCVTLSMRQPNIHISNHEMNTSLILLLVNISNHFRNVHIQHVQSDVLERSRKLIPLCIWHTQM